MQKYIITLLLVFFYYKQMGWVRFHGYDPTHIRPVHIEPNYYHLSTHTQSVQIQPMTHFNPPKLNRFPPLQNTKAHVFGICYMVLHTALELSLAYRCGTRLRVLTVTHTVMQRSHSISKPSPGSHGVTLNSIQLIIRLLQDPRGGLYHVDLNCALIPLVTTHLLLAQ